jgi:hypothetical protein
MLPPYSYQVEVTIDPRALTIAGLRELIEVMRKQLDSVVHVDGNTISGLYTHDEGETEFARGWHLHGVVESLAREYIAAGGESVQFRTVGVIPPSLPEDAEVV